MAEGTQRQGHIAVANPFENSKGHLTTKYCIWDVLQHHPEGLPLAQLVEKVSQRREAPMKNPTSTVMLLISHSGYREYLRQVQLPLGGLATLPQANTRSTYVRPCHSLTNHIRATVCNSPDMNSSRVQCRFILAWTRTRLHTLPERQPCAAT